MNRSCLALHVLPLHVVPLAAITVLLGAVAVVRWQPVLCVCVRMITRFLVQVVRCPCLAAFGACVAGKVAVVYPPLASVDAGDVTSPLFVVGCS